MGSLMLKQAIDPVPYCERWARWRIVRWTGIGWPTITVLGKVLDGLPSTKCTTCQGRGYLTNADHAAVRGRLSCKTCNGEGKIKTDSSIDKVNPAFIASTRHSGASDDPVSQHVDWVVCAMLSEDQRAVVMHEFVYSRNRNKALRHLRITHQYFNELLDGGLGLIGDELGKFFLQKTGP